MEFNAFIKHELLTLNIFVHCTATVGVTSHRKPYCSDTHMSDSFALFLLGARLQLVSQSCEEHLIFEETKTALIQCSY